jgi:hypothetical protein
LNIRANNPFPSLLNVARPDRFIGYEQRGIVNRLTYSRAIFETKLALYIRDSETTRFDTLTLSEICPDRGRKPEYELTSLKSLHNLPTPLVAVAFAG